MSSYIVLYILRAMAKGVLAQNYVAKLYFVSYENLSAVLGFHHF